MERPGQEREQQRGRGDEGAPLSLWAKSEGSMVAAKRADRILEEILEALRARLPELGQRYHVTGLGVFGSYARGEQGRKSDLDILVEFSEAPTFFQFLDLEEDCASYSE